MTGDQTPRFSAVLEEYLDLREISIPDPQGYAEQAQREECEMKRSQRNLNLNRLRHMMDVLTDSL